MLLLEYDIRDVANCVSNCPQCVVAKGHYKGPKTMLGSSVTNNELNLLCMNFTKMNLSKDGKEDVLVPTDACFIFSQVFVTANQKTPTIAHIIIGKWLYVYGISGHIHSDRGCLFDKEILEHLYSLYRVKQPITMPYYPGVSLQYEKFNCILHDLFKSLKNRHHIGLCIYHLWHFLIILCLTV